MSTTKKAVFSNEPIAYQCYPQTMQTLKQILLFANNSEIVDQCVKKVFDSLTDIVHFVPLYDVR